MHMIIIDPLDNECVDHKEISKVLNELMTEQVRSTHSLQLVIPQQKQYRYNRDHIPQNTNRQYFRDR
jgi:hypothetical protein